MAGVSRPEKTFTPKQGQYLAYIYLYTRLHRRPPAETDMQEYFRVSPPSVSPDGAYPGTDRPDPKATKDPTQHRTAR
jgi:hypothetical protein